MASNGISKDAERVLWQESQFLTTGILKQPVKKEKPVTGRTYATPYVHHVKNHK